MVYVMCTEDKTRTVSLCIPPHLRVILSDKLSNQSIALNYSFSCSPINPLSITLWAASMSCPAAIYDCIRILLRTVHDNELCSLHSFDEFAGNSAEPSMSSGRNSLSLRSQLHDLCLLLLGAPVSPPCLCCVCVTSLSQAQPYLPPTTLVQLTADVRLLSLIICHYHEQQQQQQQQQAS
jgi:hypothetical protein